MSPAALCASPRLRDTTSTLHPARPKRWAIPRPIPLLAPVTMTLRPLREVNMPTLLTLRGTRTLRGTLRGTRASRVTRAQKLPAHQLLRQLDRALGVTRSQLARERHLGMRGQPRGQQDTPQDHERGDFCQVDGPQRQSLAIAVAPRPQEFRNDGFMLDETHRGGEIVEQPAETAIVEIDDAQPAAVRQQVGEPQIGMHQTEHIGTLAEALEPKPDELQRTFQNDRS